MNRQKAMKFFYHLTDFGASQFLGISLGCLINPSFQRGGRAANPNSSTVLTVFLRGQWLEIAAKGSRWKPLKRLRNGLAVASPSLKPCLSGWLTKSDFTAGAGDGISEFVATPHCLSKIIPFKITHKKCFRLKKVCNRFAAAAIYLQHERGRHGVGPAIRNQPIRGGVCRSRDTVCQSGLYGGVAPASGWPHGGGCHPGCVHYSCTKGRVSWPRNDPVRLALPDGSICHYRRFACSTPPTIPRTGSVYAILAEPA